MAKSAQYKAAAGTDVAGVGDTNGDGIDDVLIASTPYALDGRDWPGL